MGRKIAYWASTTIAGVLLLMSLTYLTGSEQVVSGFAKEGYPQHLRIVLGVAKPAAAIVLLLPGLALLKEWAYAGTFFQITGAAVSHALVGDPVNVIYPLALMMATLVSWALRPPSRMLR